MSLVAGHQAHPEEARTDRGLPVQASRSGRGAGLIPLWCVLAFAALAIGARLALHWQLPFPQCWLRKLTGIPCPTCGATRSLAAWSYLDLNEAFRFNPLFFLICIGLIAWLVVWGAERVFRCAVTAKLWPCVSRRVLWSAGFALVALNWLYLYLTLPK